MSSKPQKIAVIGAGIAGLTCAYELQKEGHQVTVFEKNTHVGGRMSSRTKTNLIFDIGADHLCEWYREMKRYCAEFDIPWEKMRFLAYGIVQNKQVVTRDQAAGFWGKWRLAIQYFRTPVVDEDFFNLSNLVDYDNEAGYEYMKRTCGKKVADYLVDAFSSTYQFHRASEISKAANFGIIHSLKTHLDNWELYRTKGGMQALPNAFANKLNIKLGCAIEQVMGGETNCQVDGEKYDKVVLAATATASKKLLTNATPAQASLFDKAKYASSISIAFLVPKKLLPQIAVVWVPYVESTKISGYVNEMMKGEETIQGDYALLCTWLHEDYARSIMDLPDEEIFAQVKKELLQVCPWFSNEDQIKNHDLQRWPEAMPKFYIGYLTTVKNFLDHHQGENNIYLCGDYMNSLWTEGALRGGQRTAALINAKEFNVES